MPRPVDVALAEQLLRDAGWSALLPLEHLARRQGCAVFAARVYSRRGDADVQVQIYDFAGEPEAIADYEEELTALERAGASQKALVRTLRVREWGIVVTSAREDTPTVERALRPLEDEQGVLTYHPQLKRILGGDYFHQFHDRWLKACLCPYYRAMEMKEQLAEARSAYHAAPPWSGRLDDGLPVVLAILSAPGVEVEGLPPDEGEIVIVQLFVQSAEPLVVSPSRNPQDLFAFARQFLGCAGALHRDGLRLNRDAGTCVHREFLTRSGALTDTYFMTRSEEASVLQTRAVHDLWSALVIICDMAKSNVEAALAAAREGIVTYARQASLATGIAALIDYAVRDYVAGRPDTLVALAKAVEAQRAT